MKANGFEMFALMLCSCLFGIIASAYNMHNLVTAREMILVGTLYITVIIFVYIQHATEDALVRHLRCHTNEVEQQEVIHLQESHRRSVLFLKNAHAVESRQLQAGLKSAHAQFDRLNHDYEWMTNQYQDQLRLVQEQEDRMSYLEGKLHETGQTNPTTRQPFSAPPSQIRFANPPRRQLFSGAPSPLHQVMKPEETEDVTEPEV